MTIRTTDIENEVVDRLTAGEPLAAILRSPGMPKPSTWYDWCAADKDLSGRVARAREHGADSIAADCMIIADHAMGDYRMGEKCPIVDQDNIQRSKLRVETRLKLLRCWDPRYGEKVQADVNHSGAVGFSLTIKPRGG